MTGRYETHSLSIAREPHTAEEKEKRQEKNNAAKANAIGLRRGRLITFGYP